MSEWSNHPARQVMRRFFSDRGFTDGEQWGASFNLLEALDAAGFAVVEQEPAPAFMDKSDLPPPQNRERRPVDLPDDVVCVTEPVDRAVRTLGELVRVALDDESHNGDDLIDAVLHVPADQRFDLLMAAVFLMAGDLRDRL